MQYNASMREISVFSTDVEILRGIFKINIRPVYVLQLHNEKSGVAIKLLMD